MLARLVTRRARRGTCARRTEYLDSIRTRRRTDAHTRSISFSRAHMTVHDDNSITPKRSPRMSLRTQACLESFNPQLPNDMGLRRCGVRTKRTVRSFVELVMYLTSPPALSWSERAVKSFQIFIPEENSQQHGGVRGALLLRLVKRLTSRSICPTNPY